MSDGFIGAGEELPNWLIENDLVCKNGNHRRAALEHLVPRDFRLGGASEEMREFLLGESGAAAMRT